MKNTLLILLVSAMALNGQSILRNSATTNTEPNLITFIESITINPTNGITSAQATNIANAMIASVAPLTNGDGRALFFSNTVAIPNLGASYAGGLYVVPDSGGRITSLTNPAAYQSMRANADSDAFEWFTPVTSEDITNTASALALNYVATSNGRGTNATFYLDSGAWFLAEPTTGIRFLGYDNSAWFGGTDALISEVPYTNTVGIGGNGQYLYALSGSGITSGSISNAAIADATITSNKLAFAVATPTDVTNAVTGHFTTVAPLTNNETRSVTFLNSLFTIGDSTGSNVINLSGDQGFIGAGPAGFVFQDTTSSIHVPGGVEFSGTNIAEGTIPSNRLAFAIGSGSTYSNITESGYSTTVRSNFVVSAGSANTLAVTNGRVGIGTLSPVADLNIGDTVDSVPLGITPTIQALISDTSNNGIVAYSLYVKESANNPRASLYLDDANNVLGIDLGASSTRPDFIIRGAAERFRVTSSGNVGIGTTNPAANLHVAGSVLATNFALGSATINSWDDVTNYFTMPSGSGSATNLTPWASDINADGNNLYEAATIYGSSNAAALTLTGSVAAQDNAITIYQTNSGNGITYFAPVNGHEFVGPVTFQDSLGAITTTGNLTATGTSNYVAALHTDTFSMDDLNVNNLYGTNVFTLITNATGLATDGDGKIIAGSGGGTTYSNLTETGYVSGFRSNVVVTGNALGTAITPLLTLSNATAAINGTQQNSPALMLGGAGYNTTGSTSAPVSMGFVTVPVQGTTPTARMTLVKSIGGAAASTTGFDVTESGTITAGSFYGTGYFAIGGGKFVAYAPVDGHLQLMNSSATGFTLFGFGPGSSTATLNLTTNWPALRVENSTNRVRLGVREGTNTTNFGEISARFVRPIKAGFSTNYTINPKTESTIFWSGTNQVLTLPDPTLAPGEEITLVGATTTGSAIATNHNGSVTLKGVLSVDIGATNTVVFRSDGSNWW